MKHPRSMYPAYSCAICDRFPVVDDIITSCRGRTSNSGMSASPRLFLG